ncbi:MAG: sigma-70 family RNA polymerase sigma factor, partial [Planctomycetes bacterium]|nr:sigma-70 family RNA polymerase sigma factor [Planctomycetota bacterium]
MPEPSLATELQRHAAAMRQLARDLVGRDSADDLVQDTAVRALRSPPAVRQGLFGWLATVMRNLAANRRRDDARRLRRERASDTGVVEACSAADLAMRRDTARVVTESLWALPEPYQRTLVLRYFQGLAPTQIAAATGVPLATVKSRLQRGLEQLRADVARRDGRDWRMALAPAFGLGVPAGYWLPFSVASMGAFGKTAACVVVGSLGCLSWWIGRSEPDVDVPIEVVTLLEPSGAPANSALPAAGERDPVGRVEATSARSEPDLAHAFALELQCTVVDPEGAPVVGAQVAVAPPGAVLATWPVATNADGKVTVSFGARVPAMVCAVGLVHSGQKALQQVRLESGKAAHVAFVVGVAPMPFAVRVDANGEQIAEVPSCVDSATDCRQCHQPSIGPDTFVVHGQVAPGWHPAAVFRAADAIAIRSDFATQAMRSANALALTWRLTEQPQSIGSVLTGRVFGADGRPVRAVRVLAQRLPARDWSATVRTKADGSFELDGVADGRIELRVGGGAEGAMRHEVTIQAGKRDH